MNDTPDFIAKKQFEIIFSKTPAERLMMAMEMIEFGIMQTHHLIRRQQPNLSELEFKIAFFKLYYADELPEAVANGIIEQMKARYEEK